MEVPIKTAILLLAVLFGTSSDDDALTVTLSFDKMHCEECRAEIETLAKKLPGYKSVQTSGNTTIVVLEESAPIPAFNRLPKDLALKAVGLSVRGTVSFSGDKATLVAKGSGASLALLNPGRTDRLAELKKQLGGKNRFRVAGALSGGKSLTLDSFTAADWKDK